MDSISSEESFPFDAYCCGQKMNKTYLDGGYVKYSCASNSHGRLFVISIDAKKPSYCSCCSGGSPMRTKNFGNFRLYHGCPYCGARYSIVKNDLHISFEVDEDNSTDVSEVALKSLHAIWDYIGNPLQSNSRDEVQTMKKVVDTANKIIGVRDFL